MIGMSCDAYAEERAEIAALLEKAAPLADACNLWVEGRPAEYVFTQMGDTLRKWIASEVGREHDIPRIDSTLAAEGKETT